ncbi:MAG: RDD family protein, partial [Terracidiphilus sp.]
MDPISNQLNIETPELVSIEMPIAGIGSRFIAVVVDYLILLAGGIVFVMMLIVVLAAVHVFARWSENWVIGFFGIVIFLVNWGYFTLFEAFWNGRTPGKRAAKIRVIHRSGRAMSFLESLARNLVRFIDYLPGFYAVGVVAIFVSKQNQRLGDMVAGTLVVHDRELDTPLWGEMGNRTFTAATFATPAPENARMA